MNRHQTCCPCQPIFSRLPSSQATGWRRPADLLPPVHSQVSSLTLLLCLSLGSLGLGLTAIPAQSQTQPSVSSPADTTRPTLRLGSQGAAVTELQSLLKLLGYYAGAINGNYQESTATAVSAFQQAAGLQPDGITGTATWNRLLPNPPAISQPASQTVQPAANPTANFPSRPAPAPTPTPAPSASSRPAAPSPAPTSGYTPLTPAPAPTPTPRPTSSASSAAPGSATSEQPVLRVGATGAAVIRLQERLKALGVFKGNIDGVFGAETVAAVQQAQRNNNLEPDGVVGPATWAVLSQR